MLRPPVLLAAAVLLTGAGPSAHRLLVVFAPGPASAALAEQRAAEDPAGNAERDLRRIEVVGDRVSGTTATATALRHRYGVAAGAFRVVLVGKDGGIKLDSPRPIGAAALFATIDAMPMRRAEIAR